MNTKKTNYFIGFLLNLFADILICVIMICIYSFDFSRWICYFSIITIINLIKHTAILKYLKLKLFSLSYLFLVLSNVFHFGQAFIMAFVKNYKYIDSNFVIDDITSKKTLIFCYIVISLLYYGMIWAYIKPKNKKYITNYVLSNLFKRNDEKLLLKCGIVIILVSFPLKLKYVLTQAQFLGSGNYSRALSEASSIYNGVILQISDFLVVGMIMVLLANRNSIRKSRMIFLGEIFILALFMFSGGRLYSVISVLLLCYVYLNKIERVNYKKIIFLVPVCIIALQILTSVSVLRAKGAISISDVICIIFSPEHNFILQIFDEFGGTVFTVRRALIEIPRYLNYHYGLSYLKSFAFIGVSINGSLKDIQSSIEFTTLYKLKYAYGGSYIAELYYNFGYYSYIVSPFLGFFVGKIFNCAEENLKRDNLIFFTYFIMPVYSCLLWVRGYFNCFTRSSVWAIFMLLGLYWIIPKFKITSKSCVKVHEGKF